MKSNKHKEKRNETNEKTTNKNILKQTNKNGITSKHESTSTIRNV